MASATFTYPSKGPGRPQILLLGNGLEQKSNQLAWDKLLEKLTVEDALPISKEQRDRIPFPILYHLLSTHNPAPAQLSRDAIKEEEQRLKAVIAQLQHQSNEFIDILPSLDADHIMTTNYSYCIEKAFFPKADFSKPATRTQKRFRLGKRERDYKLHTGYLARNHTRDTGIWHIHGECCAPQGIVLGHDRYGRLLRRIEEICDSQKYPDSMDPIEKKYDSWPELFLYGDVYILGLTLGLSEFDLWWLLRRKQRECYADGHVYFYERRPLEGFQDDRYLLLQACGVTICDVGVTKEQKHDIFYTAALEDIRQKISNSRIDSSAQGRAGIC